MLDEGVVDLAVDFLGVRPREKLPKPSCCLVGGQVTGVLDRDFWFRAATLSRKRDSAGPIFAPLPAPVAACFTSAVGFDASLVALNGLELPSVSRASLMRRSLLWCKSTRAFFLPLTICRWTRSF